MEDTYKGQVDNPLSLNRYMYVSNNPLRYIDPTGHTNENAGSDSGRSGLNFFDWNKLSDESQQELIDRYIKYGPESIPEGIRSTVEIMADPSSLIPGAGGVKIVGKAAGALAAKLAKSKEHMIYTLRDPITNEVKYVGRTINEIAREASHKLLKEKNILFRKGTRDH